MTLVTAHRLEESSVSRVGVEGTQKKCVGPKTIACLSARLSEGIFMFSPKFGRHKYATSKRVEMGDQRMRVPAGDRPARCRRERRPGTILKTESELYPKARQQAQSRG